MSSPKTTVEIYRCPASKCRCGQGGGALLVRAYRDPSHKGDVVHVACPKSKSTVIEIVLGEKLDKP